MANNKMLIDASHPEETRVVVLRGNRIEEFDFESASKKPLRGNIYLAKVTRVEPSLQAAFVEYGGNRHGFLAFPEIHPDYYQIPVADRQALLEEEARERSEEDGEEEERRPQRRNNNNRRRRPDDRSRRRRDNGDAVISAEAPQPFTGADAAGIEAEGGHDAVPAHEAGATGEAAEQFESASATPAELHDATAVEQQPQAAAAPLIEAAGTQLEGSPAAGPAMEPPHAPESEPVVAREDQGGIAGQEAGGEAGQEPSDLADDGSDEDSEDEDESDEEEEEEEENVEQLGGDTEDFIPHPVRRTRRQYKIQEVIKRRQVLLVQVVKEERGNKGAALTTYLSLAGRYSVLMPNTARGGGISRKITDGEDRRRLKDIVQDLDVPEGMGVILRTAGASRSTDEVRRDFEYLLRMWESVRELTLRSTAPTLVYEEGSLIKRSIRDLYGKDVDEVIVAGDQGHREARDYMKMLLPGQVGNVRQWHEPAPLFTRWGVEQQLDSMFTNVVTLKSGGYIVINQTEALVAIDVNSGRSTREHNIEDTAVRTNIEAAEEVARQLRLRDLAGLIVVDFIDMDEHRNNRAVERKLKDALKSDRARIQVGRISHFGLLEMSRQRMRPGVLEGSSVVCPHCMGAGTVRSTASIALHVLRLVEDALLRNNSYNLIVKTRASVALYILNQKRGHLRELEQRFGVDLIIDADETLTGSIYHAIERGEPASGPAEPMRPRQVQIDSISPWEGASEPVDEDIAEAGGDGDDADGEGDEPGAEAAGEDAEQRRRKRRRRRRGRDREASGVDPAADQPPDDGLAFMAEIKQPVPGETAAAEPAIPVESELSDAGGEHGGRRDRDRNRRRRRRGREFDSPQSEGGADNPGEAASGDAETPAYAGPGDPAGESAPAPAAEPSYHNGGWTLTPPGPVPASREADQMEPASAAAPAVAETPPAQTPSLVEPALATGAAESAEQARRPAPEPLPEAPPPEQKKSGWWSRMRGQ